MHRKPGLENLAVNSVPLNLASFNTEAHTQQSASVDEGVEDQWLAML